jgi:hypothetical protein
MRAEVVALQQLSPATLLPIKALLLWDPTKTPEQNKKYEDTRHNRVASSLPLSCLFKLGQKRWSLNL